MHPRLLATKIRCRLRLEYENVAKFSHQAFLMPLLQPSADVSLKDACSKVGHERVTKRLLQRGFWPQIAFDHGAKILFIRFGADFFGS